MGVRLRMERQPAALFPAQIVQEGIVALWQNGFDHEDIATVTGCHPSTVAKVLDLVRQHVGGGLRHE